MNDEDLVKVHLYGPLADKYGAMHEFAVTTPIEAVSAMEANFPGFAYDFAQHEIYYIHADGDWREGDASASLPLSREVHFIPQVEGRAFLGAMLITALFPSIAGMTILGVSAATLLGGLLVTGLLIGLSFLFKPKPPKAGKEPAKDESYSFTGPENVAAQGVAVPLLYGRVYAGSVVVSAGLEVSDEPIGAGSDETGNEVPTAPPYPGGYPKIVGTGQTRHPQGWMLKSTQVIGGSSSSEHGPQGGMANPKQTIYTYAPSPQPRKDWYYFWTANKGYYAKQQVT